MPTDPCAAVFLPPCPSACKGSVSEMVGTKCGTGDSCGNEIGDGCACADDGTWSCSPHAPLGGPGQCNKVCISGESND